jgi:hypothetical protein
MGATVTYKGTMRGAVSSAGALSIDMTETTTYKHLWDGLWDQGTYVKTAGSSDSSTSTSSSHLDAVVSLDVDGILVGTTSTGQALVWLRQ